jgi:hypothetical protein
VSAELGQQQLAGEPEPYPGFREDLARKAKRDAAAVAANAKPLPGPLANAFLAPEREVLGFRLRPVVHTDHIMLQWLDSPFLHNLAELAKPEDQRQQRASTPEEVAEFIYLFTIPPREARAFIAKGRQEFRAAALEAISDKLHPADVLALAEAAREHYVASWATKLSLARKIEGDGNFFSMPEPHQTTASAGGSTTSSDS